MPNQPAETLEAALARFKIKPKAWDFLVVSDGSGTTWDKAAGWASTVIERRSLERTVLFGGFNHGTNNLAEIMACVQAMMWINRERLKARPKGWDVHLITDSQYVANSGARPWTELKEHRELWLLLHGYSRRGVRLHWHWNRRAQLDLNRLADSVAGAARKRMAKSMAGDPYQCEPAE